MIRWEKIKWEKDKVRRGSGGGRIRRDKDLVEERQGGKGTRRAVEFSLYMFISYIYI